jgi:aquaporin Z
VGMNTENWRTYAAELLGTFTLVFIGTTAIVAAGREHVPVLAVVPFAFGLALLAGLYAFGEVSGGHYNPAVSLAMFLDRRLPASELIAFWVAQFIGAILASVILLIGTSRNAVKSTATVPSSDGVAFLFEVVFTALFVLVILQASRSDRFGSSALIAIPLTLLAAHFAAIPFSGSSLNPARTFGPDLVGNVWTGVWIYFIAPPLGAAIAWGIHAFVVTGSIGPAAPAVAEVLEQPEDTRAQS